MQFAQIHNAGCVEDVQGGPRRLIVELTIVTTPAQGITPAHSSTTVQAFDATSGKSLWRRSLKTTACKFAATADGKWAVVQPYEGETFVIDLSTGAARRVPHELDVLGDYLIDRGNGYSPNRSTIIDPATLRPLGHLEQIQFNAEPDTAPGGMFFTESDGSSPPAGITSDAKRLIATVDASGTPRVIAYSLPSGAAAWERPKSFEPWITGDFGGVLLTLADEGSRLQGLDDTTGKLLWSVHLSNDAQVCGATASQTLLAVNGQLATLSTRTGKQLSYTGDSTCPDLRPGGIEVDSPEETDSADTVTIKQALKP